MDDKSLRIEFWKHAIPFAMVYGVVWGVAGISLPLIAVTAHRAGLVFAMLNLGIGVAAPLWGHLSRKASVSGLVFLSTLLSGLAWVALTLLGNFLLPVTALLFGLFASGIFALASVQVTKIFPKEKWDRYIALMQGIMTGGQVIGLLATSLYAGAALGLPFLLVGIVGGAWVARKAIHRGVEELEQLSFSHVRLSTILPGIMHGHLNVRFHPRHLLHFRHPLLAVVLTRWTLLLLAWAPIFAIYPLMMKHAFGLSGAFTSILYSGSTALTVVLYLAAGALAERKTPYLSMTVGALISTVSFGLMYLASLLGNGILGAVAFVLMVGSYAFVAVGMNDGVVGIVSEKQQGEALGVGNALMSFDNVVGGIVGGVIVSALGYGVIFGAGFVICAIAVVMGILSRVLSARPQSVQ